MTRHTTLLVVVALAALAQEAPAARQAGDEASVPRISVGDLKKGLAEGLYLVVDVRDAASFAAGRIPGAVLVPLGDVKTKVAELKAARKTIVTYCG